MTTTLTDADCKRCGGASWVGLTGGSPVRLDPARLTRGGELVALVAGRRTYDVSAFGARRAIRRGALRIAGLWPAYGFVHAAHACRSRWPPELLDTRPDMPWVAPEVYARLTATVCPF